MPQIPSRSLRAPLFVAQKNRINSVAIFNIVIDLEAYIFINADPGKHWKIAEAALEMIEGVKMAHAVTGQFDVIAYAEFGNMDALADMIEKFQSLKGVQRTWTAVAIPPRLK